MKKLLLFTALLCATTIYANEAENSSAYYTASMLSEEVAFEEDSIQLSRRGPIMNVVQAVACPIDSIIGRDVQNQYTLKEVFKYDENGRTILDSICSWSEDGWIDSIMSQKAYATNGKESLSASWKWDGKEWVGQKKMEYEYDAKGKTTMVSQLTSWKDHKWVGGKGDYKNVFTYTYAYGSAGKTTREEHYTWGTDNWACSTAKDFTYYTNGKDSAVVEYTGNSNQWIHKKETLKRYDSYGNTILNQELTSYNADNQTWSGGANSVRKIYEYNSSKKQLLKEEYSWDTNKNDWKGSANKEVYEYNSKNKETLKVTFSWNTTVWGWVLLDSTVTIYDENDRLIENKTKYIWNTTTNSWSGSGTRTVNTYDTNGNKTEVTTFTWANDKWAEKGKTLYEYNGKTEIAKTSQTYTDGDWLNKNRTVHHYEGSILLQDTTYTWDKTNKIWKNSSYIDYTPENKTITYTWQTDATWKVTNITGDSTSTIYKDGLLVENSSFTWSFTKDRWNGSSRALYYYDELGRDTLQESYTWGTDDWKYNYIQRKKYDEVGNKIFEERLDWKNDVWTPNFKHEYEYDEFGNTIHEARWTGEGTTWIGASCWYRTYDKNGTLLSYASSKWLNDAWVKDYKEDYETIQKSNSVVTQTIYSKGIDGEYVYSTKTEVEKDLVGHEINNKKWHWVIDETEEEKGYWCLTSKVEKNYDQTGAGRLRDEWNVTYSTTDCDAITIYDMRRYYYSCDNYYTVTFVDWDDTELSSLRVLEGEVPNITKIATPTRDEDVQFVYEFDGWDKDVVAATADATYKATYTTTTKQYTVTFKDEDNNEWQKSKFDYGTEPVYTNTEPTKPATDEFTYTFVGWGEGLKPVHGDTTYIATFEATKRSYDITFSYGEQSHSETLEYGAPIATAWTPTLTNTDEFEYSFLGWKDLADGATVTGTATYEANVSETKRNYTVTIIVGEENYSAELPYGTPYAAILAAAMAEFDIVEVDGQYRFEDAEYTYTFIGWAEVETLPETVTGNATYTMLFNKEPKNPTGVETFEQNTAPVKIYENGVLYILRNGKKYTPAGSFVQ